jgi:hypothetical protein
MSKAEAAFEVDSETSSILQQEVEERVRKMKIF